MRIYHSEASKIYNSAIEPFSCTTLLLVSLEPPPAIRSPNPSVMIMQSNRFRTDVLRLPNLWLPVLLFLMLVLSLMTRVLSQKAWRACPVLLIEVQSSMTQEVLYYGSAMLVGREIPASKHDMVHSTIKSHECGSCCVIGRALRWLKRITETSSILTA